LYYNWLRSPTENSGKEWQRNTWPFSQDHNFAQGLGIIAIQLLPKTGQGTAKERFPLVFTEVPGNTAFLGLPASGNRII
jgi:hypothetical protein